MTVLDFVLLYIAGAILALLEYRREFGKCGTEKFNDFNLRYPEIKWSYSTFKIVTLVVAMVFWPLIVVAWLLSLVALFFMAIRMVILYFIKR